MGKIDDAYEIYQKYIFDESLNKLLTDSNLPIPGSVASVRWELFGSKLTGRNRVQNTGADLNGCEVKSAKTGGSFEYQYHLNTGAEKLKDDCKVNHIFCTYSETYKDVTVYAIKGEQLAAKHFEKWIDGYLKNYEISSTGTKLQRFRKTIPYGYVKKNGKIILTIVNSKLEIRNHELLENFNQQSEEVIQFQGIVSES